MFSYPSCGWHTGVAGEVTMLAKEGPPTMTDYVNGGNDYFVFRVIFRDFLTRKAFLPKPYGDL
jgi:GrpB-like predicted nucleotidyltransferase (UPF0157 family)